MLGKESEESLKDIYKNIAKKGLDLHSSPVYVTHNGKMYKIYVILKMSLVDGKMRNILSGLGGAFCMLCTCTCDEAIYPDHCFTINRTGEQIDDIWRKLSSGEIVKKPCDYSTRLGVTREPIVDLESIASVSPLHSLLRLFDFILKIIYHLNAELFIWSDEKKVLGNKYLDLQKSKVTLRTCIKEGTNISVDMPDSTGK